MQIINNFNSPLVQAILEHIKKFDGYSCNFYTASRVLTDKETQSLEILGLSVVRDKKEQIYKLNW